MESTLFHIYGPFSIHTYGLFVALGFLVFNYLSKKDINHQHLMPESLFFSTIIWGTITAFFGARLIYILNNRDSISHLSQIFEAWNGGLSILGAIIAPFVFIPFYLFKHGVPILSFFDTITPYMPVWQSVARIGCFFAGCCYGTDMPSMLSIKIYDLTGISLTTHPTQLYSMFFLLIIALIIHIIKPYSTVGNGHITFLYLALMSIERFFIEFFRAEVVYLNAPYYLSLNQCIALIIFIMAFLMLTFTFYHSPEKA